MNGFALPSGTHIGHIRLQVSDLDRALSFYRDLLGFRQVDQDSAQTTLSATGGPPSHILLSERPGARRKPSGTTGLYHMAIRFASRRALSRIFGRLLDHRWPFQGFSDHGVSEALYLADADGNGVELYVDRPRERWPRENGHIAMTTQPLDVEALLAESERDTSPWTGIDPDTDIGHVHLHVSDLAQAEAFYGDFLGLQVTQRGYPGALFLAAGTYHHHLGVNTWAGRGAPPPPPDAVGLLSFAVHVPDETAWQGLIARLQEAGLEVKEPLEASGGALVHDPDGTGVELIPSMHAADAGARPPRNSKWAALTSKQAGNDIYCRRYAR
jgi:catechol 2,3-dioxygenase